MKSLLPLALLISNLLLSQNPKIDSLKLVLKNNNSSALQIEANNQLGIQNMMIGNVPEAPKYFRISLKYNEQKKNPFEWVRSMAEIGNILSITSSNKKGLDTLILAKDALALINSSTEKQSLEMRLYKYIGDMYSRSGLFDESFPYLFNSIDIANKLKNNAQVAKNYSSIANNYSKLRDYTKANKYNSIALVKFKDLKDTIGMSNVYANWSSSYAESGNYDSALILAKQCEEISSLFNYDLNVPSVLGVYIEAKRNKKDYAAAFEYNKKLLAIDLENENVPGIGFDYESLAFIYRDMNSNDSSIKYFNKALNIFKDVKMNKEISTCYNELLTIYLKTKNTDSATHYLSLYEAAKTNYLNEEKQNDIIKAEIKYETAIKEATIAKQTIQMQEQKKQNLALIIGGLLACGVALGLGLFYKKIRKQNKQIQTQKYEILHNNKNSIQQLISIFSLQAHKENNGNAKENQERLYALNLLNKFLYENEAQNQANVKPYLTELCEAKRISSGTPIAIHVNAPSLVLKSNILKDIGLIVNELTTNTLKYGVNNIINPVIDILLAKNDDETLLLKINDNGNGFSKDFDLNQSRKSFGLDFVCDLVEQHHGSIKAYNNNGACFEMKLNIR